MDYELYNKFFDVCKNGSVYEVKAMLEEYDIDPFIQRNRAINVAIRNPEVMIYLLETFECDLSKDNYYAVRKPLYCMDYDLLKYLLYKSNLDTSLFDFVMIKWLFDQESENVDFDKFYLLLLNHSTKPYIHNIDEKYKPIDVIIKELKNGI